MKVVLRWTGVPLLASTTLTLDIVAPWNPDGGSVLYCVHRKEAPSGAVVTSMASLARGFALF
jgi:hypothetical protein